ncbi:hypothetical protein ACOSP7_030246 [Xanthoceras sorbifolium]
MLFSFWYKYDFYYNNDMVFGSYIVQALLQFCVIDLCRLHFVDGVKLKNVRLTAVDLLFFFLKGYNYNNNNCRDLSAVDLLDGLHRGLLYNDKVCEDILIEPGVFIQQVSARHTRSCFQPPLLDSGDGDKLPINFSSLLTDR